MKSNPTVIIVGNLIVAYLISLYSVTWGFVWFIFAMAFQFGRWYGGEKKEEEIINSDIEAKEL